MSPTGSSRRSRVDRILIGIAGVAVIAVGVRVFLVSRENTRVEAMRGSLRRLALAQESYRYDHGVYSADLQALVARGFELAAATEIEVNEATVRGWSATARHHASVVRCFLFVADAAPVGVADSVGVVRCG